MTFHDCIYKYYCDIVCLYIYIITVSLCIRAVDGLQVYV